MRRRLDRRLHDVRMFVSVTEWYGSQAFEGGHSLAFQVSQDWALTILRKAQIEGPWGARGLPYCTRGLEGRT